MYFLPPSALIKTSSFPSRSLSSRARFFCFVLFHRREIHSDSSDSSVCIRPLVLILFHKARASPISSMAALHKTNARDVILGGIPRSRLPQLFQYMYSTAPKPQATDEKKTSIAGFGYGLPIARLYARYFQGNLTLASVENLGTTAYISLQVKYFRLEFSHLNFGLFFSFFSLQQSIPGMC